MARIIRPQQARRPLRSAKLYPYGTVIVMRRGTFVVAPTQVHVTDEDFDIDYYEVKKSWYELPEDVEPARFVDHLFSQVRADVLR